MPVPCRATGCEEVAAWAPVVAFWAAPGVGPAVECPVSLYVCTKDCESMKLSDVAGEGFWKVADQTMDRFHKVHGDRTTAVLRFWPLEKAERWFAKARA